LQGGRIEQSFSEVARITKEKKVIANDSKLLKVYDRYIYICKDTDITIIDFES
jgi:hypothetical protein